MCMQPIFSLLNRGTVQQKTLRTTFCNGPFLNILNYCKGLKKQQAEAELCQAQDKLSLAGLRLKLYLFGLVS